MKELIDKLAVHAGYLERYRSGDQRVMAGDIRAAIAALEAAEAKFEEARADNHRMALELADLLCERKELRARVSRLEREVAGLEGMVPKKWHRKLLRNAVIEHRKRAAFDPNDPYKHLAFLENCEDCIAWLDALIATSKEEV